MVIVDVRGRGHGRETLVEDSAFYFHPLDGFFGHKHLELELVIVQLDFFYFSLQLLVLGVVFLVLYACGDAACISLAFLPRRGCG